MAKTTPPERTYVIEPEEQQQPRAISSTDTQAVEPYFRASMHTELLKFDIGSKYIQPMLGEDIDSLETVSYGLDLSENQDRALHAIQRMLDETDYQGDGQIPYNSAEFKMYGSYLPYLERTPTNYYQHYGLEPAGDGKYHGVQVKQAREALESLAQMVSWMRYKKLSGKRGKDGKPLYDLITVKRPLVMLQYQDSYTDITQEDIQKIARGETLSEDKESRRAMKFIIIPSPILIDEIRSHYLLKPASLHEEIKALYPGKRYSSYVRLFIQLLLTVDIAVWKIGKETLARKLNMDALIENRQKSRIDKRIQEALETAKELDFLLDYDEDAAGLLTLRLNPERCSRVRSKLARKKRVKDKETEDEKDSYITQ